MIRICSHAPLVSEAHVVKRGGNGYWDIFTDVCAGGGLDLVCGGAPLGGLGTGFLGLGFLYSYAWMMSTIERLASGLGQLERV